MLAHRIQSLKASGRSQKAWLWTAVSADSVFFLIDPSRSARVAMVLFASTKGVVFLACVLPAGFYGLSVILIMLAFMTMARVRTPERLRSPGARVSAWITSSRHDRIRVRIANASIWNVRVLAHRGPSRGQRATTSSD